MQQRATEQVLAVAMEIELTSGIFYFPVIIFDEKVNHFSIEYFLENCVKSESNFGVVYFVLGL